MSIDLPWFIIEPKKSFFPEPAKAVFPSGSGGCQTANGIKATPWGCGYAGLPIETDGGF